MSKTMGEIRVGTSGYSYQDWKGAFYPQNLASKDFLKHYSNFFDCVEIDSTYYRIPSLFLIDALTKKVPSSFRFTVKTPSTFTHTRDKFLETLEPFRKATAPMIRKGMLACYLAQFPSSFPYSKDSLAHIADIANNLDAPLCVEFRKRDWQKDEVYEFLREKRTGFANVDTPRFKTLPVPSAVATSEIGYVRFHGRNVAKWWRHEQTYERYDYVYTTEELQEWIPRIKQIQEKTKVTYILFNNHFRAKAIDSANNMKKLLGIEAGQSTF
ncbi:MAG: DUF72 domain-containing protein [Thaumarchaeota archaeon]|nr:DUF72 domain-containing protein [Nitrososphaerota archaeon]